MKILELRLCIVLLLCISLIACKSNKTDEMQAVLEVKSAKLLKADGFEFKDLNRNGTIDNYEDWRLENEDRANDLLSKMSLEQKAGFMIISSTRLENDWSFQRGKDTGEITSGFNEEDLIMDINIFTRKPLPYPNMAAAGTTKDVNEFHKRHFIIRANPPAETLAKWANNLQALCESNGLGIPAIITSNPRNHITTDASIGLSVAKTPFTSFPGELGLAAMRDLSLVRAFGDISRQEWLATGIRKGYMYMADLATEPRWQRTEGTFGEDAKLAADVIREVVLGFQGETLGPSSIALTTKHFPGGGAAEGGQDPHFDWGKRELFEGDMFDKNLIPFKAAIDAGTSSIMPYYSYPAETEFEEVGYAFNKEILQDVLRKKLGFKGIINSDTGPIDMMPWGVEDLSIIQRYKKAIEAGVNIFSGTADPAQLIETLTAHPELMPLVDESVRLLLLEKFELGLFENPYVDVEAVATIMRKAEFQEKADLALRKSIVLLRNTENILPLKGRTKVYFETHMQKNGGPPSTVFQPKNNSWDVEFVDEPEKADVNILWLIPKGKSLFQSDGSPLHVDLSNNGIDVKYINEIINKPTVLVVNYTNPWAIDEVYQKDSKNIRSVIATFGTSPEALLDIITGKFTPSGKMPFTTPISDEAAQNQKSDVPGYLEGEEYGLFDFDEGMISY